MVEQEQRPAMGSSSHPPGMLSSVPLCDHVSVLLSRKVTTLACALIRRFTLVHVEGRYSVF